MATDEHPYQLHSEAMLANAVPPAALNLIKAFGLHVNLPELSFNDQDACLVSFGERIVTITVDCKGSALVLRCAVIHTPEDADEQFLARLLVGNFSTATARTGALAIDAKSGEIILMARLSLMGLSPEDLQHAIERIANGAAFWQQDIAQMPPLETL
ncbi:type III secretion system chaperone [Pseudochelatococcus sp. G4_1912]|uniref:type III secretion system chaperone n=1 Tax=Pseudochelatococcus sp. G4_1912 TaxID=3114288 RepID=UPI0039C6E19E